MTDEKQARVTAGQVLRSRKMWIPAAVILSLFSFFLSLTYMGAIVNPQQAMRELPVGLVNADTGAGQIDFGQQLTAGIAGASTDGKVAWKQLTEQQARDEMAKGKLYGALVVPENFTASVLALGGPAQPGAQRPTVTVLTNPAAGSLASSMATSVAQQAAHSASTQLGARLTAQTAAHQPATTGAQQFLLADPIAVRTDVGHALSGNSGLGMTAFFYMLLLVMCGFIGANVLHGLVDSGLGFGPSDFGPWRSHRPTAPIDRRHTLFTAWGLLAGLAVPMAALVMLACVTVLGMDAGHLPLLFTFSYCAIVVVGISCLSVLATFGTPGILVTTFVFIALAIPSSGGTIPLETVPGFYRAISSFEPMRQLTDGVRAILYFDAAGDAGLNRAWTMMGFGLLLALALGYGATTLYERKGLHRHLKAEIAS
ncbi:YhgE/Pip domain-containing protein [Nocardia sp. NPDC052566]|uniref:YhgE/Pip domain-containing protein n=1 Tax=Nocardia sp. NPDC052566 TaxID=3364330 RepID=UPI0037C702B3